MKLLIASVACAGLAAPLLAQAPRPNVILVMADDQGYGDVAFQDHPHLVTPTLDELAATAVRFERFYSASAVCSPTRGSCLTGRHPSRYGIGTANVGHMPAREVTLGELLGANGYRTGHFGKWHLGTLTKTEPDSNRGGPNGVAHYAPPWEHGFDRCFSTEAKVPTFDPMKTPPSWTGGVGKKELGTPYGTAYWDESGAKVTENLDGDDSRVIMDRAVEFVTEAARAGEPFFAVIWFHAPHLPVLAGPEHLAHYDADLERQQRHYYGCITALDEQLGRLRARLSELDVRDDTMLWYCSDNGPEGNSKSPGRTDGLRGRKRSLFEGGVRVPAFLEWPARFGKPRTIAAPCVTSDYLPTIAAALELDAPKRSLDGVNLLPLLNGDVATRNRAIGFQFGKQASWVEDRFKLVLREERDKGEQALLFDLSTDPAEQNDLADDQPERVARMQRALAEWRESCAKSALENDDK